MSHTTTEQHPEKESCPRVPSAQRDPDGFCTVHGWECADFAIAMEAEEAAVEPDDEPPICTPDDPRLPVYTPDDPRFPEIEIELLGHHASPLSIISRVSKKMRERGFDQTTIDEFHKAVVTSGDADAARHQIMCWVFVTIPDPEDD